MNAGGPGPLPVSRPPPMSQTSILSTGWNSDPGFKTLAMNTSAPRDGRDAGRKGGRQGERACDETHWMSERLGLPWTNGALDAVLGAGHPEAIA
jgi:hypothetical protein